VTLLAMKNRYGIEQEYTLLQKDVKWPLGWPVGGYPGPQVLKLYNNTPLLSWNAIPLCIMWTIWREKQDDVFTLCMIG
jgi:hypothetical protein